MKRGWRGRLAMVALVVAMGISGQLASGAGGWKGAVKVTIWQKWQDERRGTSEDGMATLSCELTGTGSEARCSYASKDELRGKDGTLTTVKTANETPTSISVGVSGSKLSLTIGVIPVTVVGTGTVNIMPTTQRIDGGTFTLPAQPDSDLQSGVWLDPKNTATIKTTVTWSFKKQ